MGTHPLSVRKERKVKACASPRKFLSLFRKTSITKNKVKQKKAKGRKEGKRKR